MGYLEPKLATNFVKSLRAIKIQQNKADPLKGCVPVTLEIAYLPAQEPAEDQTTPVKNYFYPGVFLSSQIARFVRPVQNLQVGGTEWIGPLEQVNLSIACLEEDLRSDSTHQEIDPINMLSIIASTIPFADYNQSPRNMYQC
mmetsp:Transcript_19854/g.14295  ORF Transcript_19854/g.14295 Transcript_19854/m.14295 type:complete len:142 (+) Transcript_19854:1788-2213(+)